MTTLYILVGLPGSGKSNFVENSLSKLTTAAWISRDNIRFSLVKENEPYFSKEKEVKNIYIKQINDYLARGYDVFADATQVNEASRNFILSRANKFVKKVAIFINTPIETCIQRNAMRKGRLRVPEISIRDMATRLTKPTIKEGFDEVWEIDIKERN